MVKSKGMSVLCEPLERHGNYYNQNNIRITNLDHFLTLQVSVKRKAHFDWPYELHAVLGPKAVVPSGHFLQFRCIPGYAI